MEAFQFYDLPFAHAFLKNLYDMQQKKIMCDMILVVENCEIHVHKLVLCAASPYFRLLETTKFKETVDNKIEFPDLSLNILQILIQFLYTGHIEINDSNVYDIMSASHMFQISILKLGITHYLISSMKAETCLEILAYAQLYNYEELFFLTTKYIVEYFHFVVTKDVFLYAPTEIVKHVLCQKGINLKNICQALDKWMKHNAKINELPYDYEKTVDTIETLLEIKESHPTFSDLLTNIIDFITVNYPEEKNNLIDNETSLIETQIVLCIGGSSKGTIWANVEAYHTKTWSMSLPNLTPSEPLPKLLSRVIPPMAEPRMHFALTQPYNNQEILYVLGGLGPEGDLATCERYDINKNSWTKICELPQPTKKMAAVFLDKQLIVLGGENLGKVTADVWEYTDRDNSWQKGVSLLEARSGHNACNVLGTIFVLGGLGSQSIKLSSVERFNADLRTWSYVSKMPEAKYEFGCAVINEFIYVIGGATNYFVLNSVHKYNTITDEWEQCADMPVPKCSFGCTVLNGKIFCVGGSDIVHGPLSSVEVYNPNTNRWHYLSDKLQTNRAYSSAVTVNVFTTNSFFKL